MTRPTIHGREIAIIGIGCRFPGATTAAEFWRNLRDGVESITFFSDEELRAAGVPRSVREDPRYVRAHGVLEAPDFFDSGFFGISPKEADIMDPQHRLVLERAWEAIEDSGYDPDRLAGPVGVYAGGYVNRYLNEVVDPDDPTSVFIGKLGNEADYLATRISYKLNLTGPSLTVQTACSTSLVAVGLACQSLVTGACDVALAGGVTVRAGEPPGYYYQEGGILSSDGHCRALDADAEGTVIGDGVGFVVLKRLQDALQDHDTIRAVIKGSAVGNDGAARVGFTAPGVEGQSRLVHAAQRAAEVAPDTITYVELHGSATPLGDRIEVDALTRAFRLGGWSQGSCGLASVKTNIGHTHAAAGVAGLIKTVLALEHQMLPPSLHFVRPNPRIDFAASPFYVNAELKDWKSNGAPRRAGVSSFGMGGTGAHVVLEEAPPPRPRGRSRSWQVLPLSARSTTAVEAATDRLVEHLHRCPDLELADVAHTLSTGRRAFPERRAVVVENREDALDVLRDRDARRILANVPQTGERTLAFMFPGLGDQYVQMGRQLYESERIFREELDRCMQLLGRLGVNLKAILYPASPESHRIGPDDMPNGPAGVLDLRRMLGRDKDRPPAPSALFNTRHAQPAIFSIEYALAQLWIAWGARPDVLIGYSIGEYVAACVAGVLSLEDALFLVAHRARLISKLPHGVMLALPLPEEQVRSLVDSTVAVAAVNGPALCVVAGPEDSVAAVEARLREMGVAGRRVQTSHAFHSPMMEPVAAEFTQLVRSVALNEPAIPYLSNVSGDWVISGQVTDPGYWARHMCEAVRFGDGVWKLWGMSRPILLEVGPGQSLGSLALQARQDDAAGEGLVFASLPHAYAQQSEVRVMLTTLAKLWLAGVSVDWGSLHADEQRRRVPLPTYPFERRRHRIGRSRPDEDSMPTKRPALARKPDIADWFSVPAWAPLPPLPLTAPDLSGEPRRWLLFVHEGGIGARLGSRLRHSGHDVTTVVVGDRLQQLGASHYAIDPRRTEDYEALMAQLRCSTGLPNRIVHTWAATSDDPVRPDQRLFEQIQQRGFYSLLRLAQVLGREDLRESVEVSVVSTGVHAFDAAVASCPEKATLLGVCRVWPQENPSITCRSIDVTLSSSSTRGEGRSTEALLAELVMPLDDPVIAHRGLRRWRQTYVPVRLTGVHDPARVLRPRGTYMITGGLGGMGLAFAEYLARAVQARLVLIGRSPLPPRNEWQRWVTTEDGEDVTAVRIRKVEELEACGSEVLVIGADVGDPLQMESAVQEARQRFGPIHGVIHAAGVPGGGLIQLKEPEAARRVLRPKVEGARVIAAMSDPLDFIVFCSSMLSVTGGLGQVDYCAANAFLDALAEHNQAVGGPFTVSMNWDAWRDVGMAVRTVGRAREQNPTGSAPESVQHPLLGTRLVATPRHAVYSSVFSVADTWLIDEHRMLGNAVVPGTGHLEMVRAAYANYDGAESLELLDVRFYTPIVVKEDGAQEVRVVLERDGVGCRFSVITRDGDGDDSAERWQLHSDGWVGRCDPVPLRRHDVGSLIQTRGLRDVGRPAHSGPMSFGPRSRCLDRVYVGDKDFLAFLELPSEFSSDLAQLGLHPSLMDIATAFVGLHLAQELRIPISYKSIKMYARLPRRIVSHQRYQEDDRLGKETISCDITILDEHGQELVCVEGFVLKRVGDLEARLTTVREGTSTEIAFYEPPDTGQRLIGAESGFLAEHLEQGIGTSEGMEAFARILSAGVSSQVLVSTKDLDATMEHINAARTELVATRTQSGANHTTHPRANLLTAYVEPRNVTERRLAALWQELLGVEPIGIHDNFFELGGHSLLGLQLVARLREAFGIEVPLGVLFEALTVAELAAAVGIGANAGGAPARAEAPASASTSKVRPASRCARK